MPSTRRLALGIEAVSWGFVRLGVLRPLAFGTPALAMTLPAWLLLARRSCERGAD